MSFTEGDCRHQHCVRVSGHPYLGAPGLVLRFEAQTEAPQAVIWRMALPRHLAVGVFESAAVNAMHAACFEPPFRHREFGGGLVGR